MNRMSTVVRVKRARIGQVRSELVAVPVERGRVARVARALGARLGRGLQRRARSQRFTGAQGEVLALDGEEQTTLLIGLGETPGPPAWLRAGAHLRREADARGARRAVLGVPTGGVAPEVLSALAQGVHLAGYRFDAHRAADRPSRLATLLVVGPELDPGPALDRAAGDAAVVAAAVAEARDLVNQPPSIATPSHLAAYARGVARESRHLTAQVWNEERMGREGVRGLLAVARGSSEPPRFIVLRYRPPGATRHVALVGKAITFDSGGLSLKPPKSMETMKYDMAGGAAVLATVAGAARLALPVAISAFVPATENLPGQAAQKPGDVIRYANDKTVEVLNTDAEGRLVLADALVLASRERPRPDAIIDLATLTGAARIALGVRYAAVMGTEQALVEALVDSGTRTAEPLWQLPLVEQYRDDLRSTVADLRNIGTGPEGGTITAGLFLQAFVEGAPWAHLDIAGPAFADKDWPECRRGGTGFGVRLLLAYLCGLAGD